MFVLIFILAFQDLELGTKDGFVLVFIRGYLSADLKESKPRPAQRAKPTRRCRPASRDAI